MSFSRRAGVFANLVAGKTRDAAVFAARKTKNATHIARLNMSISAKRDTIKRAYGEIGKLYYETHKDAPEGFFVQLCQEIDVAMEDIADMEVEIIRLKTDSRESAEDADYEPVEDGTAADDEADGIEIEITVEPDEPEVGANADAPAEPEAADAAE